MAGPASRCSAQTEPPVNYWVYRLMFEDPDLQPLWMTLIGVGQHGRLLTPSHDALRSRIEAARAAIEPSLNSIADHLLASFLSAFQPSRVLAEARERAIAEGLRQQRARIAASLLQPGSFTVAPSERRRRRTPCSTRRSTAARVASTT